MAVNGKKHHLRRHRSNVNNDVNKSNVINEDGLEVQIMDELVPLETLNSGIVLNVHKGIVIITK